MPAPRPAVLCHRNGRLCAGAAAQGAAHALVLSFEQQFHYGIFYSYFRLREQEIRNLMWVAECVSQKQKNRVHDGLVIPW